MLSEQPCRVAHLMCIGPANRPITCTDAVAPSYRDRILSVIQGQSVCLKDVKQVVVGYSVKGVLEI
jgi:hypothetical protein